MWTLQNAANRHRFVGLIGTCCAGLLAVTGCTKHTETAPVATTAPVAQPATSTTGELTWAREALKRNPLIEIVATDTAAGVFTIRFRESGEVRAVKLSELAAAPVSTLTASIRTAAATPSPATTSEPPAPTTSGQATQPTQSPTPTSTATTASTASDAQTSQNYTIQREGGQLRVSGPGVSIVSTGEGSVANTTAEANQRGADPIICEGRRMVHFDNRNISVDGDAIIARGGCELYITNSRIVAAGTGIVIGDATVHIANSTIQGNAASFDASDTAKVYVRGSTFQGLPRRAERAVVQDQGGNLWR